MTLLAFGMPFVALAFLGAFGYAIARYNRKPEEAKQTGYYIQGAKATWHWHR